MPANAKRTAPENHTLYYVEDDTKMVYLTHDLKDEHRLIETWYHEDFVKAHMDPKHSQIENLDSTSKEPNNG